MALATLMRAMLGVEHTSIKNAWFETDPQGTQVLVVRVEPLAGRKRRCGVCRRPAKRYDRGRGLRRWRSLDHGTTRCYLEAAAPRVRCRTHGAVVAHVPWAAHRAGHTHAFDAQVAWLATKTSRTAATELMRISWSTVGAIVSRVYAAAKAAAAKNGSDGLDGLRRIGIDEVSYKRGRKYLSVVVDHDTGLLVWAGEGNTRATLAGFFDALGPDRCAQISHVTADGAPYIAREVAARCPGAVQAADPFHVIRWAQDALNRVRLDAYNAARAVIRHDPPARPGAARQGQWLPGRDTAKALRGARLALGKNPGNLTRRQQGQLAWIQAHDPDLWRAYRLKEALRAVFTTDPDNPDNPDNPDAAPAALDAWLSWARRSRLPAFVDLARKITNHRDAILTAITHGLSNGRVESINAQIRVLTRLAHGFHHAHALISLAMLTLGPHQPALPGRT